MSDILKRLEDVRDDRNPEEDTWDGWQIAEEAIAEIKRLRSVVERLRLTVEERESVQRAAAFLTKLAERQGGGE